MPKNIFNIMLFVSIVLPLFFLPTTSAAEPAFENTASVQWLGTPLRESLERFCESRRIHFFLDRRIDPTQTIHLELSNQTVKQVFTALAEKTDTGCYFLDDAGTTIVYLGTKETAELLPLLLEKHRRELSAMPTAQRNIPNKKTPFRLPFLGEPKQAILDLIKSSGFSLSSSPNSGAEALPFDLWNKTDLPALPFYKLLTMLLIGFEKDYEIEGNTFRIVPLPELQTLETLKTDLPKQPPEAAETQTKEPQTTASPKAPLSQRRFTLKVDEQPLGAVLDVLSKRLGLTIVINWKPLETKDVSPEHLVTFEVKNATVNELFRTICKPLKLEYRLQGETVIIK
ncbi:MAG: hypothetical protein FWE67_07765 [Planctomycetaceae bacterium]|nr:hypothetical protein [Planctomycetaceae bacterium]